MSLGKDRITGEDNAGIWYADFCRFLGESEDNPLVKMKVTTEGEHVNIALIVALGDLFSLVVYGQLILENVELHGISERPAPTPHQSAPARDRPRRAARSGRCACLQ